MRAVVVAGWIAAWVALLAPGLGAPGARAEPQGHVTAVSVAVLSLYADWRAAEPARRLPREEFPIPAPVHEVAPNKRLKVRLGAEWVWIDRGVVRTRGVQSAATCAGDEAAAPTPSVLAPRGLGRPCR